MKINLKIKKKLKEIKQKLRELYKLDDELLALKAVKWLRKADKSKRIPVNLDDL